MNRLSLERTVNELDNRLKYRDFTPDSIISIVTMTDHESHARFGNGYLSNITGLMMKNGDDIQAIYTSVFPSTDVLTELFERGSHDALLISKHPMDWEEMGRGFVPIPRWGIELLSSRRISLYSAHSAMDNSPFSPSLHFAQQFGYTVRDELKIGGRNFGYVVDAPVGSTFESVRGKLLVVSGLSDVQSRYHHDTVERMAVSSGGGDNLALLDLAIEQGCDTYVTGILHFRGSAYAKAHNLNFIDGLKQSKLNAFGASHYLTELAGIKAFSLDLSNRVGIPVQFIMEKAKAEELHREWGMSI